MNHGDETNPSLQESELTGDEINDIAAVFDSLLTATKLRDMTDGVIYDTQQSLSIALRIPHHPDVALQFYPAVTRSSGDLRLRIRLYPGDIVDGLADREQLVPAPDGSKQVNSVASKSVLIALDQDTITPTLRKVLVKTKAVLLNELPLETVPTGEEGKSDYPLDELDIVYVGDHSLWAQEALDGYEDLVNSDATTV